MKPPSFAHIQITKLINQITMKKYLFSALALGMMLTSCQSEEPKPGQPGSNEEVAFTISLPDVIGTRATDHTSWTNSALGGATNNVGKDVTFTLALYLDDYQVYGEKQTVTCTGNRTSVTFNPKMVIGENYHFVAYAEFDSDVNPMAMDAIEFKQALNDETVDEYFVAKDVVAAPQLSAELKRPYGKLRLLADDWDEAERQFNSHIESVKVEYDFGRAKTFDAKTGYFSMPDANFCKVMEASRVDYTEGEFIAAGSSVVEKENVDYKTIFVDYIPAHPVDDTMMPFMLTVTFENGQVYQRSFIQEIPIRRNWLTTLKGDLFTIGSEITLIIEETFDNEHVENIVNP